LVIVCPSDEDYKARSGNWGIKSCVTGFFSKVGGGGSHQCTFLRSPPPGL